MQPSKQSVEQYDLNGTTKLRVVNVPHNESYNIRLTLTHTARMFKPMTFETPKQVADFFGTLDYENEQQLLTFRESTNERLLKSAIQQEIRIEMELVGQGKKTVDEAMAQVDLYIDEWVGADDDETYPFPLKWDSNQRKNWIHSRNHHRREMRASYKGTGDK